MSWESLLGGARVTRQYVVRPRVLDRAATSVVAEMLEPRRLFAIDAGGEPTEPPDPIFADDLEPNNSFAAATSIGNTLTYSHDFLTIHKPTTGSDVDYFKFTAPVNATVVATISFVQLAGQDLKFEAFDGAQQSIATSNASTVAHPIETITLNVSAGQTYYLKVAGSTSTATNPEYSIDLSPLSASFDWSMPKRFGNQLDPWGLPIIQNTRDYARPDPTVINGVEVPRFGVRFDASSSVLGAGASFAWHVVGNSYDVTFPSSNAVFTTDLPEGTYTVTLTGTTAGGTQLSSQPQTVKVVDHLIVAMGDSYGSGEGNPHQGQQYDFFGFTTSGAKWAQGLDGDQTAANRRAHRSSYAGIVKAAVDLENADPKSSVTLVFLDHTGAKIPDLIGGAGYAQASGDEGEPGTDPGQFDQMAQIVGNRKVDALVLSVGGNDAGFLNIGSQLVVADPEKDGGAYAGELDKIWADAAAGRSQLASQYVALDFKIRQFDIGHVFLTEYPDPTHDGSGGIANKILDDIADGYEIDHNELTLVHDRVLVPLAQRMAQSAVEHKWTYVSDIASAFNNHGYGDWFRTASDSLVQQGPLDNVILGGDKTKTTGTLHPTSAGQEVYRQRLDAVFGQPDLVTTSFTLSPSAFLPGASDGYTLTVENRSLYASAGASVARIYVSADAQVDRTDTGVFDIPIPALAAGASYTISGILPVVTDPYRSWSNFDYVAPVLDVNDQVAESDEYDNYSVGETDRITNVPDIATVQSDRDFQATPFVTVTGREIKPGQSIAASIGLDEFAGPYDMDVYTFDATKGQRVALDVDDAAGNPNFDTYLRVYPLLFNFVDTGNMVASNDNARAPGEGATQNGESYAEFTAGSTGRFCVIVSHASNGGIDPTFPERRVPGQQGAYSISMSLVAVQPPPVATSIVVNDNSAQRSRVTSLSVSFDKPVTLAPGAALLVRLNTGGSGANDDSAPDDASAALGTPTTPDGGVTWIFPVAGTGSFVERGNTGAPTGSLVDGIYCLSLDPAKVTAGGVAMTEAPSLTFHRLFGDANGNRTVNLQDYGLFRSAFGKSSGQAGFDSTFDFDGNGSINTLDYGQFRTRYGKAFAY